MLLLDPCTVGMHPNGVRAPHADVHVVRARGGCWCGLGYHPPDQSYPKALRAESPHRRAIVRRCSSGCGYG
jgi:hypothetical protein